MEEFIFGNLIPAFHLKKGRGHEDSELHLINNALKLNQTLFYPSCGGLAHIEHLFYLNNQVIPEFMDLNPKVFIHSDPYNRYDFIEFNYNREYEECKNYLTKKFHFTLLNETLYCNESKTLIIYKLKRPNSDDVTWLICFCGYKNEEIIKALLEKEIKIPIVYSKGDGESSGMGYMRGNIPTILYPLLNFELGIKFIVTEQSWKTINENGSVEMVIEGLKAILNLPNTNNKFFKNLLLMEKHSIFEYIGKILENHSEKELSQIKYKTLLLKEIQNTY